MKFSSTILVAIFAILIGSQLQSVSLAYTPSGTPVLQRLRAYRENSDAIVFGELIKVVPANKEQGFAGRSIIKFRHILKDSSKKFENGEIQTLQRDLKFTEGEQLLLIGDFEKQGIHWWLTVQSSTAVQQYLENAPATDAAAKEQLIYFLRFLEHQDPLIAEDANSEVSGLWGLRVLAEKEVSVLLDRNKFRNWISQARIKHPERVYTYAKLLGVCGDESDSLFLKDMIFETNEEASYRLEGVVIGYLVLTGEQGLDILDEEILKDADSPFLQKFAVWQAVRFMHRYAEDRITNDRLSQSLRILLNEPNLADLVIVDLSIIPDWSVGDRLMTMYTDEKYNVPSIKRSIARYFLVAVKSWDETSQEVAPAYVIQARQNIKTLEESDPKTMRNARRYIFE